MQNESLIWGALAAFYNKFSGLINLLLIVTLSSIGRALYTGGTGKAIFGDLLICYVIVAVISPHIPPVIFGLEINERDVAAVVGILGVHGMRQLLSFAVKKKTGIDINKLGVQNENK